MWLKPSMRRNVASFMDFLGQLALLRGLVLVLCLAIFGAHASDDKTPAGEYEIVSWDDLMPEGWVPPEPEPYYDFESFSEEEALPEVLDSAAQSGLPEAKEMAPVVAALDQRQLKIPGYVIPIKFADKSLSEFLLVPYMGACIHVPPPPENQMVYVTLNEPWEIEELWTPVWVSGEMSTQLTFTEYAAVGYHMKNARAEIYTY